MYEPSPYKTWLRANFDRGAYDLAVSGMQLVPPAELGEPENPDDPAALAKLAETIAAHHDRPAIEVVPALGTSHALWLAYAATLSFGDDVLVETPAYEPLVSAAAGLGATIRSFARRTEENYAIDVARIVSLLTPKTKLVSLSNLHNPSGVRIPDEILRELATALALRNVQLHVDEVYAPFDACLEPGGHFSRTARRLGGNVIATGSLTKVFGLALHRIGWLIASPAVADSARAAIDASIGHAPVRWGNLAIHAFGKLPELAERSRRLLGTKRETVAAWMRARPHLIWSEPAEGLYGLAVCANAQFDADAAIERAIAEQSVVVVPSRFFGVKNGFRLAWSLDEERLPEALNRLDRVFSTAR